MEIEQNCNILTPTLLAITALLPRSPGLLNRGPTLLGAVFLYHILSPTNWTSCALSYITVRRQPSSCGRHKSHSFNPSTVKVIFWYSSTGCTCYLHRCISYFDSPARSKVNIQQYLSKIWSKLNISTLWLDILMFYILVNRSDNTLTASLRGMWKLEKKRKRNKKWKNASRECMCVWETQRQRQTDRDRQTERKRESFIDFNAISTCLK